MRRSCLSGGIKPATFGLLVYCSTTSALKTSPRMRNFGYSNPATQCNLVVMFMTFAGQSFLFNHLRAIWPKGYQSKSLGKSHQNGDYRKYPHIG